MPCSPAVGQPLKFCFILQRQFRHEAIVLNHRYGLLNGQTAWAVPDAHGTSRVVRKKVTKIDVIHRTLYQAQIEHGIRTPRN